MSTSIRPPRPLSFPSWRQRPDPIEVDSPSSRWSQRSSHSGDSSPVNTAFSSRLHSHYPSSTSSLSSTPPASEGQEKLAASVSSIKKPSSFLPDVAEHPSERESTGDRALSPQRWSFDLPKRRNTSHVARHSDTLYHAHSDDYDPRDLDYQWSPAAKRRRSGDSSLSNLASKIVTRFPSLSRRTSLTRRRRSSVQAADNLASSPASPQIQSRSSSRAVSIRDRSREFDRDHVDSPRLASQIDTIVEDEDLYSIRPEEYVDEGDLPRVSTPLLPPVMVNMLPEEPLQSPLQSPKVADESMTASVSFTPADTPHITNADPFVKQLTTATHYAQSPHVLPASDIPPIAIGDPPDEWDDVLGHANFHIRPAPYLPETFTMESWEQLHKDWTRARLEFSKHLAKTSIHFGQSSKTYKKTEEKWAVVDAQWRSFNDAAAARVAENGDSPQDLILVEPAPIARIPSMNDPQSEGKFPTLGDNDIVGPMTKAESQLKRRPSKKAQFFHMLNGFQFPRTILWRSSSTEVRTP